MPLINLNVVTLVLKRCWIFLAILIIVAALISSVFRALTPWAKQYKTALEHHVSTLLGEPVTIDRMETGWYWFEPVIKLKYVTISNGRNDVIRLKKLLVGINLFESLWHWQIQPGILYIDNLQLTLRQVNDRWSVDGLGEIPELKSDTFSYSPMLAWLLTQQTIIIKNLSTTIYLQNGKLMSLKMLNLLVKNRYGNYQIKGGAYLEPPQGLKSTNFAAAQTSYGTNFQLLAEININPYALKKANGHAFFAIENLEFLTWQSFFPTSNFNIQGGQGNLQLWLDWQAGKLESVQSKLTVQQLTWFDKARQKKQLLKGFDANIAWNLTRTGWQLMVDQLRLQTKNVLWPENKLLIRYQNDNETYYAYAAHLILESLVAITPVLPEKLTTILAAKPHGQLDNTELQVQNAKLKYFITQFSKSGWQAQKKFPGVDNLSGVLQWQPLGGRVEFDSTLLTLKSKPLLTKLALNAAFNWKELDSGLQVNMERFIIKHRDLVIDAQGDVSNITKNDDKSINLTAKIAVAHTEKWLAYLPSNYLKPNLNLWLKHNIKQVASLVGEISVHGKMADFPFDKKPGEFLIKAYTRGMNLVFATGWPLTSDLNALWQVNKRNLEVDVTQANLQGISVNNANIRIDDIGLDKETLLLHSKIPAKAKNALAYILSSPLHNKLSILTMLQMQGDLQLDLQLELPLYPQNDNVLVLGDLSLNKTQVTFNHLLQDVKFNDLHGFLHFNQKGILNSKINASFMNYPLAMVIQSVTKPKAQTQVKINGKTSIEVLQSKFNLPFFSFMQGSLWIQSLLILSNESNAVDQIQINTSLQGVAIDLPPPFGKSAISKKPLAINIDFAAQKKLQIHVEYDKQLSSDLSFSDDTWFITIQHQAIAALLKFKPNLNRLSGVFSKLYLENPVNKVVPQSPSKPSHLSIKDMPNLDLQIKSFRFGDIDLGNVTLKATALSKAWQLDMCEITTASYQFTAKGQWREENGIKTSTLEGNVHVNDLAKSLQRLKISPVIEAKAGKIQFQVKWPGSYFDFSLPDVLGAMSINFKNGRITSLSKETEEKLGVGKLLSILSLQTIPRRLKLDFSDLSHDGYSFDVFNGNFNVAKGLMSTDDTYIDGPIAYASMSGNLDIARQFYDLNLKVSPHITASLPIVATIAGGPIAGIATWVASKIINKGMQKISGYTYKISGPWKHPVVKQGYN